MAEALLRRVKDPANIVTALRLSKSVMLNFFDFARGSSVGH